jgi:hypothetical protein
MFAQQDDKRRKLAGVLDRLNRCGADAVVIHGHQLQTGPKRIKGKNTRPV